MNTPVPKMPSISITTARAAARSLACRSAISASVKALCAAGSVWWGCSMAAWSDIVFSFQSSRHTPCAVACVFRHGTCRDYSTPPAARLLQQRFRDLLDRPDRDVAIEDLGAFGLDLDLALGQRDFLLVDNLPGIGEDHVNLAVDHVDAGLADGV